MIELRIKMWSSDSRLIVSLIILLKLLKTDCGNISSSFNQASSGVADVRTIVNVSTEALQPSSLPNVSDNHKSSVYKPIMMPEQLSAGLQLSHFPKTLIKAGLTRNNGNKSTASANPPLKTKGFIKNLFPNTSKISSTLQNSNKLNSNLVETMQIKNKPILPCVTSNQSRNDDRNSKNICIEEDCVIASATILSSLDRSTDPCENFYDFACGGWIKKALEMSTDRFQLMDKRNRKLLQNILEETKTKDSSGTDSIKGATSTKEKAKIFYKSCIQDSEEQNKANVQDLLNLIIDSGGSSFKSLKDDNNMYDKMSFDERVQWLHAKYGLSVFFTWGVIDVDKERQLAIISGGFNIGLAEDDFNKKQYLNIMQRIINLLSEAQENEIIVDLDYDEVISDSLNETKLDTSSTELINVTYEYEDISDEYNPSYEYKDSLPQSDNTLSGGETRDKSTSSSIGNTLLDFLKKPIEWIMPSTYKNQFTNKTENFNLQQSSLTNIKDDFPSTFNAKNLERDSVLSKDKNNNSSKTNIEKAITNNYKTRHAASLIRTNSEIYSL